MLSRSNVSKIRCGGGEMLLRHASLSTCALKRRSRSATISAIFSGVIVGERQTLELRRTLHRRARLVVVRVDAREVGVAPRRAAAFASRPAPSVSLCAVANPAPTTKLKAASVSERALFRSMASSPNRARREPESKARAALTTAARSHRTAARSDDLARFYVWAGEGATLAGRGADRGSVDATFAAGGRLSNGRDERLGRHSGRGDDRYRHARRHHGR